MASLTITTLFEIQILALIKKAALAQSDLHSVEVVRRHRRVIRHRFAGLREPRDCGGATGNRSVDPARRTSIGTPSFED